MGTFSNHGLQLRRRQPAIRRGTGREDVRRPGEGAGSAASHVSICGHFSSYPVGDKQGIELPKRIFDAIAGGHWPDGGQGRAGSLLDPAKVVEILDLSEPSAGGRGLSYQIYNAEAPDRYKNVTMVAKFLRAATLETDLV